MTGKLCRKEDAGQCWCRQSTRQYTTQYAPSDYGDCHYAPGAASVDLGIVIPNKRTMGLLHLIQRGSFVEVKVRETPHDPEVRLSLILPALPGINPLFTDGKSLHI